MICTIIGGGPGVNKIDSFLGFKIGLNYAYKYKDVDITVMYDNPNNIKNLNPPNLHTLKHWKGDVLYNNQHRGINYTEGHVGTCNASVIMAVNVAIHLGYTTIYLVGCENRVDKFHHFYDKGTIEGVELKRVLKSYDTTKKMWDEVELERGERLIFVDSAIDRFENITIAEYKKASLS